MGKLTQSIRDELTEYFQSWRGGEHELAAQSYEPGGTGYDPATNSRLASLVMHRRVNPEWARVRRVIDELTAPIVEVLRLAVSSSGDRFIAVACRLPSAKVLGRELALAGARERELDAVRLVHRRRGDSPMTCAMRVLEVEAEFANGRRRPHVSPWEIDHVTALGVTHGDIDVDDEAEAVVDAAVDAYVAARDALRATKRGDKARRRAEAERVLDELLGKTRRKKKTVLQVTDEEAEELREAALEHLSTIKGAA